MRLMADLDDSLGHGREQAAQHDEATEHHDAVALPQRDGAEARRRDVRRQGRLAVDGPQYVEGGVLAWCVG